VNFPKQAVLPQLEGFLVFGGVNQHYKKCTGLRWSWLGVLK
jgi:hypothetical protein